MLVIIIKNQHQTCQHEIPWLYLAPSDNYHNCNLSSRVTPMKYAWTPESMDFAISSEDITYNSSFVYHVGGKAVELSSRIPSQSFTFLKDPLCVTTCPTSWTPLASVTSNQLRKACVIRRWRTCKKKGRASRSKEINRVVARQQREFNETVDSTDVLALL